MEWQPIETFPRDGETVLAFGDGTTWAAQWTPEFDDEPGQIDAVEMDVGVVAGIGRVACSDEVTFTHWMPLPNPPATEKEPNT